jgi:hypothetical protein
MIEELLQVFRENLVAERKKIMGNRLADEHAGKSDIGFCLSELRVIDAIIAALPVGDDEAAADPTQRAIEDLEDRVAELSLSSQAEKLLLIRAHRLLDECPLGYAHGHVVMPRNLGEPELLVWVERLLKLKEELREVIARGLGAPR